MNINWKNPDFEKDVKFIIEVNDHYELPATGWIMGELLSGI